MPVALPARIPVKRSSYQYNMGSYRRNTKEKTGRGLLFFTALLLFAFIQPGFNTRAYPGVPEQAKELAEKVENDAGLTTACS